MSVEVTSDQRRRGLSWSDGKAAIEGRAALATSVGVELGVDISTLRESRRHGGADAVLDLSARYGRDLDGWRLSAGVTGHVFPGASGQGYVELDGRIGYEIGPVQLSVGASYAPPQDAIGGDNLYLSLGANAGVPGTPLTVHGHVGRSSGGIDDVLRARRLRPDNRYWDYSIGADYQIGPFAAGLRYTDTNIDAADPALPFMDRHTGSRLTGSLRVGF